MQRLPRDLQILFLSFFLWSFGYGLYNYIWPIFLRDLNADPSQVGLVISIGFLAVALSMIPGAILANKYELKLLIIVGWALSIPVPLLYYYAKTWTDVLPGLILLQASGFNLPAFNAYIAGAGKRAVSGANFGIVYSSAPLGFVFSPAIGGLLLDWISIREIFLLSFLLFAISTAVLFWTKPQPPELGGAQPYKLEFPRTISETTLLLILTGAAIGFSIASLSVPLFFQDVVKLSPNIILGLGSIQALGQTVFAILLGRRADLRSRGTTMALGLALSAAGLGGLIFTRNLFFALPLVFLVGGARASSYIAYSIIGTLRSAKSRAGQFGFYLTLESLGFVAGSYLGGFFYLAGPETGFIVAIAIFLVLAPLAKMAGFRTEEPSKSRLGDVSKDTIETN